MQFNNRAVRALTISDNLALDLTKIHWGGGGGGGTEEHSFQRSLYQSMNIRIFSVKPITVCLSMY